ncbi:MAG: hypothetical protein ACOX5Q_05720 [Bacillota bacterium]
MTQGTDSLQESVRPDPVESRIGFGFMSLLIGQTVSMIGNQFGGMALLVSLTPWLATVPLAYAIGGLMGPALQIPILTLYQDITPVDMRGRVFALRVSLSQMLSPLSFALSGVLLDALGSRLVFAGLGLVLIAASATVNALGRLRQV